MMNIKHPIAVLISLLTFSMGVFLLIFTASSSAQQNNTTPPVVYVLKVEGAIGPATVHHVQEGLKQAQSNLAELLILQIDTPGGLGSSMRSINKAILDASVPVVGYVAPSGARAASAGTFILYACHIAAMAPGTNLGAASPVQMSFPGQGGGKNGAQKTMKQKATQDAVAYIQSLAKLRNRNADWAKKAVTQAASLDVDQALEQGVINMKAATVNDLLKQLDGQKIQVLNQQKVFNTQNAKISYIKADWRTEFLKVITNPTVAYILLLIGIYGIIFEFANPGFIVPGVLGGIALLMALYALQLLPVSYAGLALIILGLIFMIAEAFMPSFGVLGFGGVVAFIVGSVMLFDTNVPGFHLSLPVILVVSAVFGITFFIAIQLIFRSFKKPVVTGVERVVGSQGQIHLDHHKIPWLYVNGAWWQVESDDKLSDNDKVEVIEVRGLKLKVHRFNNKKS